MDTTFIKGSKEIEHHFGYFPSFHDDYIDSIEITGEAIVIYIRMECAKERVKLTLEKPKKFSMEGELYGCVSILFDMTYEKCGEEIVTKFTTSLGAEGIIHSAAVAIELLTQ